MLMTDKIAVWDIETDGLLDAVTMIHCLVIRVKGVEKPLKYHYDLSLDADGGILAGLLQLETLANDGYMIGGHNTINYDHAVIEKLYPGRFTFNKAQCFDTLVMARLIESNIKDTDLVLMKQGKLPGALYGRHSLEAWGVRLGILKGDFGKKKPEEEGESVWTTFNKEMLDYCVRDVDVTAQLLLYCLKKNYSQQAIDLEHNIQWVMAQMQRNGFCFNETAAVELLVELTAHRDRLETALKATFAPWVVHLPDFIPARDNKTLGYLKGVAVKREKLVMFNPRSRDHIADRLTTLYGWVPQETTEGGKPKVDEDVMKDLSYPEAPLLCEYLMVSKRLGQLSEGDAAWLKLVNKEGRIHGSINPNGAVTGRATHSRPNISQVPNSEAPYGPACRDLFTVPKGWTLVGADASGLELRCLAHYMAKWDSGAYATELLTGDIHTVNQKAAGLPTRSNAKTFIYGYLYGAGDEKIGKIIGKGAKEGKALKASFLKGLPALKYLRDAVAEKAKTVHCLRGLDGRSVHIRSPHAALNTLLQSAGALVCKQWVVLVEQTLQDMGLKHGWNGDYALCAWSHDEIQIACRTKDIADLVAKVAVEQVTVSGEIFNFRCQLNGESKQGTTWKQTH